MRVGDKIRMMATNAQFQITELGYLGATGPIPAQTLMAGEVGYIAASIKSIGDTKVGDTITLINNPAPEPLPGYRNVNPMVFSGVYPADGAKYGDLKKHWRSCA